jgi:uncharacterized protein (TIGR02217 family)
MTYTKVYGTGIDALTKSSLFKKVYGVGIDCMIAGNVVKVFGVGIDVMFRADRAPNGGRQSIAATEGTEDTDMVYTDLIFPECITYGSTGVPTYETYKSEVDSGAEQRQQRWKYPKHEYNIKMDNLPANEIAQVMRIWHVVSGDFAAFLFMDPLDNTSAESDAGMSLTNVTMLDQQIAVAVGAQASYPLYKYYTYGAYQKQRRIRYPDVSTLVLAVDGFQVFNWSYNMATCQIDFSLGRPATTNTFTKTGNNLITSNTAGFNVGDLVYITGFANTANNAPQSGAPLRIAAISPAHYLTLQKYDGTAWGGVDETHSITLTPTLPPVGALITAGYYFYVPVRFKDGTVLPSEITAGMRDSAVANFNSIVLVEVFE